MCKLIVRWFLSDRLQQPNSISHAIEALPKIQLSPKYSVVVQSLSVVVHKVRNLQEAAISWTPSACVKTRVIEMSRPGANRRVDNTKVRSAVVLSLQLCCLAQFCEVTQTLETHYCVIFYLSIAGSVFCEVAFSAIWSLQIISFPGWTVQKPCPCSKRSTLTLSVDEHKMRNLQLIIITSYQLSWQH